VRVISQNQDICLYRFMAVNGEAGLMQSTNPHAMLFDGRLAATVAEALVTIASKISSSVAKYKQ